ncbi:hypothetical protein A3G67_03465 [Candidatus Roizmanbacteria bacterium RIFCSPLOWO2_12_FULL_40_12]|uniref:UDP-N-acetyl-alpha-D-muramoyl-L-alanyl-L-glutamate epimerase n=1 Tax=Candidatus Roizmanbacteria bacterium RIFCSPLOWO2_01_FULL_40_42 TaxID=1802066 RepID=A0A1F7J5K0_9BACT|nr:MAG: hypothetical protein A2779_03100 [Candidatus Roizmanbacteria bacterium RIFCSPHIGHO2_01_FULL_40_98]OGK28329.1 MAG: hypothetical protein A3C31_00465 [Candidatus Roizmanbacteria bacterium RIFCSPHIGHO2_02_FULL_40_53]OGK30565.1 MAG: hypothetical protein A2W49_03150 [Candidatus Roizmanbacteria bacterium RIFCSPHIGHO2_12_41_18]OGK36979.1 MAG: hypothetical protein A3E69_00725 [Candidatus Roizmanbacteria bacterium RIFCSPHIGHO2_12_FULL_40_130]OGK50885.1 MAG: hypothetical protein A3B50_01235 [Candi
MSQRGKRPKKLLVDAKITSSGIDIYLNKDRFPIRYPKKIWNAYPKEKKEILKDTLAHSSTFYVPQILGISEISYKTSRPLAESFFYKNGIYDIPYCANVDKKSSTEYLKFFFKTQYLFADDQIKTPKEILFKKEKKKKKKRAVIPFSFGKESILSYSLAKELGLEPILVSIVDPSHKYEYFHKKPLVDAFKKKTGVDVHIIEYNPGWFWEGRYWNIFTELGWGLHVTEYEILTLPFISYFDADYVIVGNEQSCKDTYIDKEGVFIYRAGYDQYKDWTQQQALLCSLLLGRKIEVMSLVEPLYEITETKILHERYPEVGKYQMSCFAVDEDSKNARWCQNCSKCSYFFPLFTAFNIDTKKLGFTENLFDKKHAKLYEVFFTRKKGTASYGSQGELAIAFYLSMKNGKTGYSIDRFKKEMLLKFMKNKKEWDKEFMGIHPTKNIPPAFKNKIIKIYEDELKGLRLR